MQTIFTTLRQTQETNENNVNQIILVTYFSENKNCYLY